MDPKQSKQGQARLIGMASKRKKKQDLSNSSPQNSHTHPSHRPKPRYQDVDLANEGDQSLSSEDSAALRGVDALDA